MFRNGGRRAANSAAAMVGAGCDPGQPEFTPAPSSRQLSRQLVLIRAGGRVVGAVHGGVFRKTVRGSVHFLRVPPAIAFDLSTLDDAERAGAARAEIFDAESGVTYSATIATIRARGFKVERGYGAQVALPLHRWRRDGEAEQLSLFGVMPYEQFT